MVYGKDKPNIFRSKPILEFETQPGRQPFSPVQRARKFSTAIGATSLKSSNLEPRVQARLKVSMIKMGDARSFWSYGKLIEFIGNMI